MGDFNPFGIAERFIRSTMLFKLLKCEPPMLVATALLDTNQAHFNLALANA